MIPEINERTKATATITFRREDLTLYPLDELPPSFVYRIDDAETGDEVRPATVVAVVANPHHLLLTAEDNRILDPAKRREVRCVTVIVTDVVAEEFFYQVKNLSRLQNP